MKISRLIGSVALTYAFIFVFCGVFKITSASAVFSPTPNSFPTIIIDPGHGGMDGGAVGVDGIIEKDINLALSLYLADFFRFSGYDVVMTRSTDTSIHYEGVTGTRKQKVSDMHNRLALIKEHPDGIFLCIHQNQFSDSRYSGGQVFYGKIKAESSSTLAEILQTNLKNMLQPENNRQIKEAYDTLYLMKNAPATSVLVECGFLSNPEEAHLLTQPEYQQKLAFIIYSSTLQFLQEDMTYGNEI